MGAPDIFSGACRPSQTAHLPLSQRPKAPVRNTAAEGRCSIGASPGSRRSRDRRLPSTLCIRGCVPAAGCSKAPRGLLFPLGARGLFVHVTWVHRVAGGDSGALVDPFMHVGTYPTRHLATLSNPKRGWTISSPSSSSSKSLYGARRMVSEASTRLSSSERTSLSLYFLPEEAS